MLEEWDVSQGAPLSIEVTLEDGLGVVIDSDYPGGGYAGTETFAVEAWPGGTLAATFSDPGAAEWLDVAAGTVAITLSAARTALLVPGRHRLRMLLDDGDNDPAEAYGAILVVHGSPGGLS